MANQTSLIKILKNLSGREDIYNLMSFSAKVENGSYMPLSIELIGRGPNGLPAYSISHTSVQNGDLMRDPEVCAELAQDNTLWPYEIRNDYAGYFREVYRISEDGRKLVNLRQKKDLESFFRMWQRNLKDQGFIQASKSVPMAV